MPIITVRMLRGRSEALKRAYIQELGEITTRLLGVPGEAVRIVLNDVAPEDWGVGSKSMAELRSIGG